MSDTPKPVDPVQVTLQQQSVHLLRQVLAGQGWCKTTSDFYIAGKILAQKLPEPDVSWVRSNEEVVEMSTEARAAYQANDKEWAATKVSFPEFTKKETETIRTCLKEMCKHMGNGKYAFAIFDFFGFKPE